MTTTPTAPVTPLEPLMGLDAFASAAALRPHIVAALKRWMREARKDPERYYAHQAWQEFLAALYAHPLT